MSMFRALAAGCFVMCAGCLDVPDSAEATGSGVSSGVERQTVRCGSSATLDRYAAGSGGVAIQIVDGAQQLVYKDTASVTGEINDSLDLEGTGGSWTFLVDPNGFAGQFKITLQCHAWFVATSE
jgi:hypothetical protein